MEKIFSKISKISLYLLFFLLPLFFLPITFEVLETNKFILFFFLVLISVIFWFLKFVFEKEIKIKKSFITFFLFLFVLVGAFSTLFSIDRYFSFWGFNPRYSQGFLSLLIFFLFYLFLSNLEEGKISTLFTLLILSSFIGEIITIFSIFGIWQKVFKISIFQGILFNPVGSLESFSLFLVCLMPVYLVNLMEVDLKRERKKTFFLAITLALALFIISIGGIKKVEVLLIICLFLFLIFTLFSKIYRQKIERLLLPLSILIVISVFLLSNFSLLVFQREVNLPFKESWRISLKSISSSVKFAVLGSGPSTYFYDYLKFKDKELNKTPFWTIRFNRSGSHFSEILASFGILGFLFYLISIILALKIGIFNFFREKNSSFLTIFLVFFVLFLTQIFYYQNFTLSFLFWAFLALLVKEGEKKTFSISYKKIPEISLVFGSVVVILIISFFIGGWKISNIWRGEYYLNLSQKVSDISQKINLQEKAVKFNSNSARYKTILANTYLRRAQQEIQKSQREQDQAIILNSFQNAISQLRGVEVRGIKIKGAVQLSPNWIFPKESLAVLYRDLSFISGNLSAVDWSIKFFEKAIELEPVNPVLHTELGKLYFRKKELGKAKEEFEKAINLKEDYLDAKVQLALVFEEEGNSEKAIEKLKEILAQNPSHIEANFQLGRVYFNKDELDSAILQFEKVLSIFPNHSNSLFSLALAYEKKGDKEKAISYLEKVLELNPDNLEVKKKLEELKGEKSEGESEEEE